MRNLKKMVIAAAIALAGGIQGFAQPSTCTLAGIVRDTDGLPVPGASIVVEGTGRGTSADAYGHFVVESIPAGTYTVKISFISYKTFASEPLAIASGETRQLNATLAEDQNMLSEVVVTWARKNNTEVSVLSQMKSSAMVISGVSSQQIARAQDRDASEVIRRIPGISVVDDKFIVVRGLSQRYNNVWINNGAVPSSEADTRAFSFDIIPSSQIENVMIVKSPAPEIPADFTGGFIKITTKDLPDKNSIQVGYSISLNTVSHFNDFKYNAGSSTDVLGFDNGMRSMKGAVGERLNNANRAQVNDATRNGFNNDWSVKTRRPLPDQRFNFMINHRFDAPSGKKWALSAALNYSNTSKSYLDMENSRYSVYDAVNDRPDPVYKYTDNQWSNDARLGAMLNLSYVPSGVSKYEFRNAFNQLGRNRLTERTGYQFISAPYNQEKTEYIYMSRSTYTGQFSGTHQISGKDPLEWNVGYSYANKRQPDRRIINRQQDLESGVSSPYFGMMKIDQNEIMRDFSTLDEHIASLGVNYNHDFNISETFRPSLKAGIYGEYRTRGYNNRQFYYRYDPSKFPSDFEYGDVAGGILTQENYGADKLYIYEETDNRNSYTASNTLAAGYLGLNIPIKKFNLYAGVRFENSRMTLNNYIAISDYRQEKKHYDQADFFPSLNATYNFTDKQLVRFAYGTSINRQEFREVSPSVYYDFDLFSDVKGNPNLKPAYIQNFDLRYEFYPSPRELISVALFYKYFRDPIEWTYLDAGGSYTFTYENAQRADNYGIEVDIKKSLNFIGLDNFTLGLNGALIKSQVNFAQGSSEHDRPMQGQSPYLVNAGLYYNSEKARISVSALYNIIGKRIVGIGRVETSGGDNINNNIPDMYEMPRNVLDLSVSKKLGKYFELKLNAKDILQQSLVFKQFPKYLDANGVLQSREQVTKKYNPGSTFTLGLSMNF